MPTIKVSKNNPNTIGSISVSGSKSESNRALIIKSINDLKKTKIYNLSTSKDTSILKDSLSPKNIIDVGMAGTTMRFLTSFFACKQGSDVTLTGSDRMKNRPIGELVKSLLKIGADINYLERENYPPLKIKGKYLKGGKIEIDGSISSQFISSMLLIANRLEQGLEINIKNDIVSFSYIETTLKVLEKFGIKSHLNNDSIYIPFQKINDEINSITIESDWSSCSYFYSIAALSKTAKIKLKYFQNKSAQSDAALIDIFKVFGVHTSHDNDQITLTKNPLHIKQDILRFNLINNPDLAQTIAVCCFGLKKKCLLKGLQTLSIKETNRLEALKKELGKLGAKVNIGNDFLEITNIDKYKNATIETYNDHRMAMAFAPLSIIQPINIQNPKVVEKSYPEFWQDIQKLGFALENVV